jgi:hypothetical protein
VMADLSSQNCWDGKNLTSPTGRRHMIHGVQDLRVSGNQIVCPEGWYRTVVFEAKVEFAFASQAEMAGAWLTSDRMAGMTQWPGGTTMHADLVPAWDYGTGDNPGVMLKFFRECVGLTMTIPNASGGGSTTLTGDPHECGFGRVSADQQMPTGPSPDGSLPNPIVNTAPDLTGTNQYFPLPSGTPIPGAVIHSPHSAAEPANDNIELAGVAPIRFALGR